MRIPRQYVHYFLKVKRFYNSATSILANKSTTHQIPYRPRPLRTLTPFLISQCPFMQDAHGGGMKRIRGVTLRRYFL